MATKKKSAAKIFVLDTNVLLHDFHSLFTFEDNDLVIPIVVLEELDRFKKGNDQINFNARETTRELDHLNGDFFGDKGVPLGKGLGRLFIEPGREYPEALKLSFPEINADHRILATAYHLKAKFEGERQVILVTKDINLRIKAKSLGIPAQDWETGKVKSFELFYKGTAIADQVPNALITELFRSEEGVPFKEFPNLGDRPNGHYYYILKGMGESALARYDPETQNLYALGKKLAYGIRPRNAEQTFALDACMRPEIQLVALTGKAGTGKTLLALAAALAQKKSFKQICLARPIVPLGNRDMGFLPGDIQEKISPYMQPLFDNLSVIKHQFKSQSPDYMQIEEMLKREELLISPLAFIRGRSLAEVYFIVDEAQNLTPHEVKTIITRAGEGTKMIFTGDIEQIDSPYLDAQSNGLTYLSDRMAGQSIFAHVHLEKGERSYLADLASRLL